LLGYGCMRLPTKKISETEREIDQETWNNLVDLSMEKGVNFFDTSPMYCRGKSEQALAIALEKYPRNRYFLSTKLSNFRPDTFSREASLSIYRDSFKALRTDYIDYYFLHAVGLGGMKRFKARYIDNGIMDFLQKEREAGRIRNLGWSFHGDVKVFDYLLETGIKWDFVLIQLNYIDWKHASGININAEYLYLELTKRNIPVMVMEPLLGGRLAKMNYYSTRLLKQKEPEASVASWAFRYAGSLPNVLTVLSGMTYKEHLIDNLHTFSPLKPVSEDDIKMLEEIAGMILDYPLISCTECRYCMPCPYGIDIPGVFAHYNKCIIEGIYPQKKEENDYRKLRRAFLIGYDRSVPKLRQANHCIGCGKCIELCPQRIDIPGEMSRIDEYVERLKTEALNQTE